MTAPAPRLTVLGLSHRTAPVGQREKAALDRDGVRSLLGRLMGDARVAEAAAVSTCNRTEVYAVSEDAEESKAALEEALVASTRISAAELACAHYWLCDEEAARHLFRVAAGIDSMVLGESEVQGQVRAAAQLAREEGSLGVLLSKLFTQALAVGGRVRRNTQIAAGPVSVSSLAVDIARRALPSLSSCRVLLVGAGRMAEASGRALARQGVRDIAVANRTLLTARELAAGLGGRAVELDALPVELARADVVICSTDAPHTIVRCADVARALDARPERPLVLIDLAVPRDVDPDVASMSGALLYDIDDVECSMHESYDARRRALHEAEAIVAGEVEHFQAARAALAASPTLDALHRRAEHIRRHELERVREQLDPDQLHLLDAVTRSLVTKLLHEPSVRLREAGSLRHTGSLHHLFALEDEEARAEPLRAAV